MSTAKPPHDKEADLKAASRAQAEAFIRLRDALDSAGSLPDDLSKLRSAFRPWQHKGILEILSSCKAPADEDIRAAFQVAEDAVTAYDKAWEAIPPGERVGGQAYHAAAVTTEPEERRRHTCST